MFCKIFLLKVWDLGKIFFKEFVREEKKKVNEIRKIICYRKFLCLLIKYGKRIFKSEFFMVIFEIIKIFLVC